MCTDLLRKYAARGGTNPAQLLKTFHIVERKPQMNILNLFINCLTAVSLMIGVIVFFQDGKRRVAENQRRAEEDQRREQEDKRKAQQATIEAYQELQKNVLIRIDEITEGDVKGFMDNTSSPDYKNFRNLLIQVDCFCVGINKGIYDFDVFYDLAKNYFNSMTGTLRPPMKTFMNYVCEKYHSKGKPNRYYENIYETWERMDEKKAALKKEPQP